MRSIILAGGFGRRLEDVVRDVPKPMALIAGKPFLEHQINFLRDNGLVDLIMAVHYKSDIIKSHFGEGMRWNVDITYSDEETPLGTAGAIKNAEKYIDETFYVFNGDSYSDADLNSFLDFHKSREYIGSVLLTEVNDASHYGSVLQEGDKIRGFSEKAQNGKGLVNSGIYLFEPKIFELIPRGRNVSLEEEILPRLAEQGQLGGYVHRGYFTDIGRPETYYKFKKNFLEKMKSLGNITVRKALEILERNQTDLLFIVGEDEKLQGVMNDNIIRRFLINGGDVGQEVSEAMVTKPTVVGRVEDSEERIYNLLRSGTRRLPILDESDRLVDIRFHNEEIERVTFPVIRGKSPLRISFAGGGTDIPYFFEKHGGAVISSTIGKYCHASARKRADQKIIIESDMVDEEVVLDSRGLKYDGQLDIVKAVYNIVRPGFGVDLHLHNDVPPGRGLGSSASFAVLMAKILGELRGEKYDDETLAEIAYRAEVEELGINGGKQDQYAAVFGGVNWIEFGSGDRKVIHPLRLRDETLNELKDHVMLCYTGMLHQSAEQHKNQKESYRENEKEVAENLRRLREIATGIKENLLSAKPNFTKVGQLLHESWENKRKFSGVSNERVDRLYDLGMSAGVYGGKLLGSGGGGYIMFFHPPEKRNGLVRTIEGEGGEILNFNFESEGVRAWYANK